MFALRFIRAASPASALGPNTKLAASPRTLYTLRPAKVAQCRAVTLRPRLGWQSTFKQAQQRAHYRRQAFNYQTFKNTQGLLRRWAARPTFYYEVGGITVVLVGFYVYNLEQVPVGLTLIQMSQTKRWLTAA